MLPSRAVRWSSTCLSARLAALAALAGAAGLVPAVTGAGLGSAARPSVEPRVSATPVERVALLNREIDRAGAAAGSLSARLAVVRRQRASTTRRIRIAERALAQSRRQLAALVRALYEQGEVDTLSIVLGAASLDDAITAVASIRQAAHAETAAVDRARILRTQLRALDRRLARKEAVLDWLAIRAAAAAARLERARAARARALAEAAPARSRAHAAAAPAQPAAAPSRRAHVSPARLVVAATAYALHGSTATGVPAGPGIIAVDPAVIPFGTRVTIPGYGVGLAADTGPSVRGARIDVWLPTRAQALAWGTRTVVVTLAR